MSDSHRKIFKMLLDKGADINVRDTNGRTPLTRMFAIQSKSRYENAIEAIKFLFENGADPNVADSDKKTPLHWAVYWYHNSFEYISLEVIKMILAKGADTNAKDKEGNTPLYDAIKWHKIEVTKLLLEHKADINAQNKQGKSPLHVAAEMGHVEAVELLLNKGANVNCLIEAISSGLFNNETVKTVKRYIIQMKTANLYISEECLRFLKSNDNMNDFQLKCEKEIARMKSENVPYFNILAKGTSSTAKYMRNADIVEVLKSGEYKVKFPIYAALIENCFRNAIERKELLEQGIKIVNLIYPELPHNLTDKILSFLSVEELKIFG